VKISKNRLVATFFGFRAVIIFAGLPKAISKLEIMAKANTCTRLAVAGRR
jgi:hypothetical protein